jgi:CBS domain containing-hemolysin-like protein
VVVKTLFRKIRFIYSLVRSKNHTGREILPFPAGEILSLVDIGAKEGAIDRQSGQMLRSILGLGDTVAREVMVPRTEIIAVSSGASIEEILDLLARHGHTRMPLYSENIDNIIGVLNVKDLLRFWSKPIGERDILSISRKAYFIPETKSALFLLHELKEMKSHMAVVIDEYGGTSGLVTLEDLIEEIVGEIHDEHDVEEEEPFVELSSGDVLVDGRTEIDEFEEYFQCEVPEGQFETVGGFILHLMKKIPLNGETVSYENLDIIVERADERSVKKVRVRRTTGRESPGDHAGST